MAVIQPAASPMDAAGWMTAVRFLDRVRQIALHHAASRHDEAPEAAQDASFGANRWNG